MSDSENSYIERLCEALAEVLTRAASGTKDRVAGYAANFDFWIEEAAHCLILIKDYDERFDRFEAAQQQVASSSSHDRDNYNRWTPPPTELKRGSSWNERKEARKKVVGAMSKFLNRCAKEGFIDEPTRSKTAARIS